MRFALSLFIVSLLLVSSCANIVPPSGGKKDITPPKLTGISPADSSRNSRPKKIVLEFDEYIQLTDAVSQIQLSPLLPVQLTITSTGKRVVVNIPDTLLQEGTTYRLSFGNAIRDLHEGNQYSNKGYTFSTGNYFDSLRIGGKILSAPTGLPDTAALVLLYAASESDSAIARHRPLYVVHADGAGTFSFEGLPAKPFRLYALRDANNNLTYDGAGEWIGFHPAVITPRSDSFLSFTLRTFAEPDSAKKSADPSNRLAGKGFVGAGGATYLVQADTGDLKRRTQELNKQLMISFAKKPSAFTPSKVFLAYDSSGITVDAGAVATLDTITRKATVSAVWKENTVYTLRLQKGFAKDSAGSDMLPGHYTFRTKREEDYGTLRIHLPTKYFGSGYVLQVTSESDTVHQKPVLDTMVVLRYLSPAKYSFRVIEDRNHNGRWDPGKLFEKQQPEIVIPYDLPVLIKAGWDNLLDFEAPPRGKPVMNNSSGATNTNRFSQPKQ